jgi:dephospho-CoA kinase
MLKVGLTGGIASGKSAVAEMFAALGAQVIQADQIAHQLMLPGQSVYKEVIHHFGAGILNADATINRSKLAEAAFGGSRIQELNHIVHPVVLQRQEQWMDEVGQRDPEAIAIVEAALILEAGAARQFERLIVVSCRPEQRIERWAKRVKVDEQTARAEVTRRMAAQWPDAEKLKAADYVIDNSGSLGDTRAQVDELFAELQTLANKGIDKV